MNIIGRKEELGKLSRILESRDPEFLALYGRRRIGKTFLIRNFFVDKDNIIFFDVTGEKKASLRKQIQHFTQRIGHVFYNGARLESVKNWDETFELLTNAIATVSQGKKIIIFMDEFPWMATKNSKLLESLDYYWNQHWSKDKRIKLIICGSSASWIIDKIVDNKGGLHNRLTEKINLSPFNLTDTKKFLNHVGIHLSNRHILEIYMVMGGVPYYLTKIEKGLSATQNIEQLTFRKNSFFLDEFNNLFSSLFDDSEIYIEILRHIAKHRYGIGQAELLKKMGTALQGKSGMRKLKALEDTGFIFGFTPYFHKKKGLYYKVIDEYTLFYFYWIEPIKQTLLKKGLTKDYWIKNHLSSSWYSWSGFAFEAICYEHLSEITDSLNLGSISVPNTWQYKPRKETKETGVQIDLLFDRDDDSITLCEIKYTQDPFTINKKEFLKLKEKLKIFREVTRTRKQIFTALISANGVKKNLYLDEIVDGGIVTMEDLFK
ncbi:MAG: AAA family ATPase [Proteobacteria bacterium]|nr:AAA family ATPase [Pseudomonadota bacterium]